MNSSILISGVKISDEIWVEYLLILVTKFSYLGINNDLASLNRYDAWDLYCTLSRLEVINGAKS